MSYDPDDFENDVIARNINQQQVVQNLLDNTAMQGVRAVLESIGEDPEREGLLDTPKRVVKAMKQMTEGYFEDPGEILSTRFTADYNQMVALTGINFTSLCEHHLLPFIGEATVAYIPGDQVVGLSKLARLVDCYAKRLQIQEQMTTQILVAIINHLEPSGCGVVVKAHHACMGCRGVKKQDAEMVTVALDGLFITSPETRAEFLGLAGAR
jgi:GTP cyclohydrolase I